MAPTYIVSSLTHFALNDVLHLLIKNPDLMYEIDTLFDQDDSVYYLDEIKSHSSISKNVLNFTGDFLKEFKEGKIRDYIYDLLLTFNYFRIENKLYETEYMIKDYYSFFNNIKSLKYIEVVEVNSFDDKPESEIYIFKNPVNDLIDIKLLETELSSRSNKKGK